MSQPKSFLCRRCDVSFTPAHDQWIFHYLCDACFREFDVQKMHGRFGGHADMFRIAPPEVLKIVGIQSADELTERPASYFESSSEWLAAVGKKPLS